MDQTARRLVRERAGYCCEYRGLPQSAIPIATFHVDHIKAKQHEGSDDPSNLSLAFGQCNRRKGTNVSGIDRETGEIVPLFNPRTDARAEHFDQRDSFIVGLTPNGRATVHLLAMNSEDQLQNRSYLE